MNETETRAELIDPALVAAGWGVVEDSRIRREFPITMGRIQPGGRRASALYADYVVFYRGKKLATIEAKSDKQEAADLRALVSPVSRPNKFANLTADCKRHRLLILQIQLHPFSQIGT